MALSFVDRACRANIESTEPISDPVKVWFETLADDCDIILQQPTSHKLCMLDLTNDAPGLMDFCPSRTSNKLEDGKTRLWIDTVPETFTCSLQLKQTAVTVEDFKAFAATKSDADSARFQNAVENPEKILMRIEEVRGKRQLLNVLEALCQFGFTEVNFAELEGGGSDD